MATRYLKNNTLEEEINHLQSQGKQVVIVTKDNFDTVVFYESQSQQELHKVKEATHVVFCDVSRYSHLETLAMRKFIMDYKDKEFILVI